MLPQNRRLRHLQGLYLRNLSFARPHGRASDDLDADLTSTTNPANKLLDGQQHQLHHARSSESLRPRPNARRRSTTLANATPVTRQRQLEYTVESRAADVFFSLHCTGGKNQTGEEDPVYISEMVERSMNFNFRFFDLSSAGPEVTRQSGLRIKVWAKRQLRWTLLLTQDVDLRSLQYLGSLQNHHFPPNCLIFHLTDGIYTLELGQPRPEPKQTMQLPTSSYNALMKLSNLDNSIQDALATREALTAQINGLLERTPPSEVPQAQEAVLRVSKRVAAQERALRAAKARRDDLQASIDARREAIREGRAAQDRAAVDVADAQDKLAASRTLVASTRESIRGQRRRICEELGRIFPIAPAAGTGSAPAPPLAFTICGLPLSNTDHDPTASGAADDVLAAALGHVAQLTHLLQFYLAVPLPYPLSPCGSRSSVRDDISLLQPPGTSSSSSGGTSFGSSFSQQQQQHPPRHQQQHQQHHPQHRTFPLFPRGAAAAQYRFDYAWFLLNKDIEALCAGAFGLKLVDIRHTLPNLKYLLYVGSAGADELPERRRGGVRGLLSSSSAAAGGRHLHHHRSLALATAATATANGGSAASSRRASADSEAPRGGHADANGAATAAVGKGGSRAASPAIGSGGGAGRGGGGGGLPFDEGATKLTLRTKGLRENVGARA
ncbi:UV radiation resistance protein and autophagy-related subunit 14-domain-containing protein [Xylariaceae sp. FL0804]|nr:UV radiation resistance protein and autophagy-related subunit 14-domain-containing protein [Xylariaceae sp. FL0804]